MSNPLTDLQSEIQTILTADPLFANIQVLVEKLQDVNFLVTQNVGKKGGMLTLITSPLAVVPKERRNQPGPYFDPITVVVRTFEYPTLNVTGTRALDATLQACALLHRATPASGIVETLVCHGYALRNDPDYIVYDATFTTMGGVKISNPSLPVVADPVIVSDGSGNITITCATAHAFVWYSVTAAYPSPRSGTFYAGPFHTSTPVLVKARAWLPGYVTSNYITTQINA